MESVVAELPKTAALCFEYLMQFKIELRYFYGWDDANWTEEIDGETKPMRFRDVNYARTVIDEFIADVQVAVAAGNMDAEAVSDDYRITEVND